MYLSLWIFEKRQGSKESKGVGANPGYEYSTDGGVTWTSTGTNGPGNTVFTWTHGDLLAGMNVGTVGRTKLFSGTLNGTVYNNVQVGPPAGTGGTWVRPRPDRVSRFTTTITARCNSSDYYNAYAAALYRLTDA